MEWHEDLVSIIIFGVFFLLLLLVAELWMRLGNPNPEWTRKLVHFGGGIACLFLPFFIDSPWVVLAMAIFLWGFFVLSNKRQLPRSLHSVSRKSRGIEYYPLSIFLVFLLAHGKPWLYLSSVLTLAVADAFAALIGGQYGVVRYQVENQKKSLEGSLVFMVLTFLAVHLPTLLMTDYPRSVCVLSALLVAILVTGFEAISLRGTDNLFVPIAVCVTLAKIIDRPVQEVIYQNLILVGICLGIGLMGCFVRTFNIGGEIVFMLFAYGTWALGSWQWALPAFLGFLIYFLLELIIPAAPRHILGVRVRILTGALLPLFSLVVFADAFTLHEFLYGPYLAACSVVLGFGLWTYLRGLIPFAGWTRGARALATALFSCLTVSLLPWLMQSLEVKTLLVVTAVCLPTCLVDDILMRRKAFHERYKLWSASKFLLTLAAAGVVALLQVAGMVSVWHPA